MKALIFDMDGVLVDVSKSYRLAIQKTAGFFLKKKIDPAEIQKLKNTGGYNNDWDLTEALIKNKGGKVGKGVVVDKFQNYYLGENFKGFIRNEKWLLDVGVLTRLKGKYKLAILTGRPKPEAEYALKRFKMEKFFDVVITMDDIPKNRQKPNPYGLRLVMRKLRVEDAIYFGDVVDDMVMAAKARVKSIGVVPAYMDGDTKKLLLEKGAVAVLDDINQLEGVLDEKIEN
ncbi:TIGR01548 family HAD-type hydrolase [Candidatus Woesearchaeota archaeon]|nr:TIGR01548 family HAD-type hydrolase [Candidatus Woesearchaeota archaeon]